MSNLTAEGFEKLLERLDDDPSQAAEKYEELRLKLIKTFVWRGCSNLYADNLADIVFDRLAKKLGERVEIENIDAYAGEVSRFVWLEHLRKNKEDAKADDDMPVQMVEAEFPENPDIRLKCLRKCVPEVTKNEAEKEIIIGYYHTKPGEKLKESRKKLADKWDLTMNNLKQKALRLRKKLEDCINDCVREPA